MINGAQYRKLRGQLQKYDPYNKMPYLNNKSWSISLAGYLKLIGASYRNVLNCCNKIVIGFDQKGNAKTRYVNRCGNPLCFNCQKVAFKKKSILNAKILDRLVKQVPGGIFRHFTFSGGSVNTSDDLHDSFIKLSKAVRIFFGYEEVKKHFVGYISSVEDKTSWTRGDMDYLPHIHLVAYFDKDITFDVQKYWNRAAKRCNLIKKYDGYSYSKKITATKGHSALDNAKTVSNYDEKPYNWLDHKLTGIKSKKNQIKAIRDHAIALYRLQKVKYGGKCKTIRKTINNVNQAKKILRKKYNNTTDVVQFIIRYNSRKKAYFFTEILVDNHYLAKHTHNITRLDTYRDSNMYIE